MRSSLLLDALGGTITPRPPFWFMRQAGRYLPEYRELRARSGSFLDMCLNPALATEITLQPIRRFQPDAAILFSDILIIPYGLGQGLRFVEGEGPILDAISGPEELAALDWDRFSSRITPTYEVVNRVRAALPEEVALIGFAGAPWTVATYMVEGGGSRDHAKVKGWAYRDPAGFQALIDILVEATIRHLSAQIEAGAEVVKLFDSWAGALSPQEFENWCLAPIAAIAGRLKKTYPAIPIIGFPRGVGVHYKRFSEEANVDAVALDSSVPTDWAADMIQAHLPVQGNLDPIALVTGGAAMVRAYERIRRDLGRGPHIFNLGHGVIPSTPPENVEELARIIKGDTSAV